MNHKKTQKYVVCRKHNEKEKAHYECKKIMFRILHFTRLLDYETKLKVKFLVRAPTVRYANK